MTGTDRRRRLHPAPPGLPDAGALASRPRAVVVGGGIAGLTAATALADRGVAVDVVERQNHLGGRVGGWTEHHDGAELAMNRGFHAFFRQYYNLRALLRRVDPQLRMLAPVDDYPLIDGAGRRDTFRGLPRTPPWNALAFALRSPTFRLRDLTRIDARAAAPLAAVSVPDIYDRLDHIDAETFLKGINFPESARHLAFEVFSRSFFAEPARLSAAELATMFHIYFLGSSEGLIFDVATANFDACLWDPLRRYLDDRGARVHLGAPARCVIPDAKGYVVQTDSGAAFDADAVVLALDVGGLQKLVDASPGLGDDGWRARIRELRTAPPFVVHRLWLDRPVDDDRPAFLGTAGHPPLDNVSVLERYEREAGAWARHHRGSVVELHSYAAVSEYRGDAAIGRLHRLYPETAAAGVIHQRVLRRGDCPLFAPGTHARRPAVITPEPRLVLAGDAIRVDLPVALMERAATTGWVAANHLLRSWGLAGHALCTVPTRGRSALLRSLAERQGRHRQ
ncbi:FAD-dependent oxidoreductase [Mycobacterium palustre]|uniref:Isorenieratene synthase n=1 Tax=Mycobacterium palustre TaxID=153971 RepID=A0A1X1ZUQ3_9MYCO|nr:FAD-dependent oxidoreductase [Mycobacterium palustre]MCV7099700.1 FAD-dependent oxidoreductase [Mycobacterium palustre]ORW27767.1 isorenieratene synthase [Mycobacterium palustre]